MTFRHLKINYNLKWFIAFTLTLSFFLFLDVFYEVHMFVNINFDNIKVRFIASRLLKIFFYSVTTVFTLLLTAEVLKAPKITQTITMYTVLTSVFTGIFLCQISVVKNHSFEGYGFPIPSLILVRDNKNYWIDYPNPLAYILNPILTFLVVFIFVYLKNFIFRRLIKPH